ncbi:MAG: hypothetical protein U0074_05295 [Kouleothrix sp.]
MPLVEVPAALLNAAQAVGPGAIQHWRVSVRKDTDTVWLGEVRNDAKEARESKRGARHPARARQARSLAASAASSISTTKPGGSRAFQHTVHQDDRLPPFTTYDFEVISKPADFQLGYSPGESSGLDARAAH